MHCSKKETAIKIVDIKIKIKYVVRYVSIRR